MLAHVDLAESFADARVDQRDAALPAIALLLHPAQRFQVEIELRSVERLRQVGRIRVDEVESHVGLPGGERLAVEELCAIADGGRLVHDELLPVAEADAGEDDLPVDVGHELVEPGQIHRIDDFADFALTLRRPGDRRDLVLDADHLLGGAGRILVADQLEDLRNVRGIGRAIGVELFAFLEVIVAVRHAESRLADPHRVARRIRRVGVDGYAERRLIIERAQQLRQAGLVLDRGDARQEGL